MRSIELSDELYAKLQAVATARGVETQDFVRHFLTVLAAADDPARAAPSDYGRNAFEVLEAFDRREQPPAPRP